MDIEIKSIGIDEETLLPILHLGVILDCEWLHQLLLIDKEEASLAIGDLFLKKLEREL